MNISRSNFPIQDVCIATESYCLEGQVWADQKDFLFRFIEGIYLIFREYERILKVLELTL